MLAIVFVLGAASAQQQYFRVQPRDVKVHEGGEVTLECEVANLAGQVQWTKDGFALGVFVCAFNYRAVMKCEMCFIYCAGCVVLPWRNFVICACELGFVIALVMYLQIREYLVCFY